MSFRNSQIIKPAGAFQINPLSAQAQGLVGWWPMALSGGRTLYDLGRRRLHGAIPASGVKWTASNQHAGALSFDGSDGVDCGTPVATAHPLTLSCWVYPQDTTSTCVFFWVGLNGAGSWTAWYLALQSGVVGANSAVVSSFGSALSARSYSASRWQHVVGVFTSSTSRKVYVDGILAGSDTTSIATSGVDKVFLGRHGVGTGSYHLGQLTDARIYNRALSDAEVWALYDPQTRYELYWQPWRADGYTSAAPQSLSVIGIPTAYFFGNPAAQPGAVALAPIGLPTEYVFGNPATQPGAVSLSPTGLPTEYALGNPAAQPGAVALAPIGLPTEYVFGNPAAQPGDVAISATGVESKEAVGNLITELFLQPHGGSPREALGETVFSPGAVNLSPTGLDSAEGSGVPLLQFTLAPVGLESAEADGIHALTTTVALAPAAIGSAEESGNSSFGSTYALALTAAEGAEAFGLAAVTPGAVVLAPTGATSEEAFGQPLAFAGLLVSLPGIESLTAFGELALQPGAVSLSLTGLDSQEAFGSAILGLNCALIGLDSKEALGAPALTTAYALAPTGIETKEALGASALTTTYALSFAGIDTGEAAGATAFQLGAVTILPVGIVTSEEHGQCVFAFALMPTGIESAEGAGNAALTTSAPVLSPSGIASEGAVGTQSVQLFAGLITPAGIASGESVGSFLVIGPGSKLILSLAARTLMTATVALRSCTVTVTVALRDGTPGGIEMDTFDIGDSVILSTEFLQGVTPVDPTTVRCKIQPPQGAAAVTYTYGTDAALVRDSAGNYHVDYDPLVAGLHRVRWEGTGAAKGAEETTFTVRRTPFA